MRYEIFLYGDLARRYRDDPEFHQLVKAIEAAIIRHGFTPLEIRQAGFLACTKYQQEHVAPFLLGPTRPLPESFTKESMRHASIDPNVWEHNARQT